MPKTRKKKAAKPITQESTTRSSGARGPALIRKFHTLQSSLRAAIDAGDHDLQQSLEGELASLGGIETYQKASIRGQDKRRGGDSSKTLVEWLKSPDLALTCRSGKLMRVLEIGSLSTDNYISRYKQTHVTRIDLNSQHPDIQQQDFLDRPAPRNEDETFDGISCSLVLNFVPASQRSDFLIHLTRFLPVSDDDKSCRWLFFVMPAPCIANSRYMDKKLLLSMFQVLGFDVVKEKVTDRIAYWLFKRVADIKPGQSFKKQELQKGATRNNFFIALQT